MTMDRDADLLKEKALLLFTREREIVSLRRKHARVSAWLTVAHSIPELISAEGISETIYAGLAARLVALLELQRVGFYELTEANTLRPLVIAGGASDVEHPLPRDVARLVAETGVGLCNEPDDNSKKALAAAVGLHRFMWYRLASERGRPVLMVAGYEPDKATFYAPFEEAEFGHFVSMGQHLALQIRNAALIGELEGERARLADLNESLERRVVERTQEIARANRDLASALAAAEDKDRRIAEDLEQARSFQQSILPAPLESARVELAVEYRPLEQVGGDIYDVSEIAPGHLRVFLADATGHGVQASLRTIVLKSEYDRLKGSYGAPDLLLREFNRKLCVQFAPGEMLCTACCFDLLLRDSGGLLRYVNAAHPPLIQLSRGIPTEIYRDGPFLGLSPEIDLPIVERPVAAGDVLLAYTDGLSDQMDGARHPFDLHQALADAARDQPRPGELVRALLGRFAAFRASAPPADDLTVIAARLLG
jgi:serine phosphatase RsbU (regulator of sigma subunit)